MDGLLADLILLLTLTAILTRPWGVNEAWWSLLAGGLVLLLGLVPPRQAWEIIVETQDALLLLIGMMALSAVAEKAGFFDRAASLAARAGGGSVARLYVMVFLVGTLVTATLSLDSTVIVMTPLVYGMVVRLRLRALPFMFACTYTANTASLFLPVSNLTNLLAYNAFDLDFVRFGLVMLLPASLAILANFVVFALLFRRDLRGFYEDRSTEVASEKRAFFWVATVGICGVLLAFFISPVIGAPIGVLALVGALIVTLVSVAGGWIRPREVAGSVSWGIIVLVVGLFVVVRGAQNAGLASVVGRAVAMASPANELPNILAVAAGSALGSNLINNVPMTVVAIGAIKAQLPAPDPPVIYAALIGTDVGPNLTVVGSLATLIWLSIMRGRGLEITAREYLKVGLISTPVIIVAAAVGLWLSLKLFAV